VNRAIPEKIGEDNRSVTDLQFSFPVPEQLPGENNEKKRDFVTEISLLSVNPAL
jgi:hypothetical protein